MASSDSNSETKWINLFKYKGLPYSGMLYSAKILDEVAEFDDFKPEDVIIYTYIKSGTHMVAEIIYSFYKHMGLLPPRDNVDHVLFELKPIKPNLQEIDLVTRLREMKTPRIICCHLPWSYLPPKVRNGEVKVIHCIRNPKDVACSLFKFAKNTISCLKQDTTWEEFLEMYTNGKTLYGDYYEFLHQWYPHRNASNNCHVYFEDAKSDMLKVVRKIGQFLGAEVSEEQLQQIATENQIEQVKQRVGQSIFLGKGDKGGWKYQFTVQQNEMVDKWIEKGSYGLDDLDIKFQ